MIASPSPVHEHAPSASSANVPAPISGESPTRPGRLPVVPPVDVAAATFTATSSTAGTLIYSVDGVEVTKSIERTTLVPVSIAGLYVGGVSGRRTGCATSGTIVDTMQFAILHSSVTGDLRIDQLSARTGLLVCRMEGRALQSGKLLTVSGASYSCVDGWAGPAHIFNLRPTSGGFEGQWFSDAGGGCTESGQLSGVTQTP